MRKILQLLLVLTLSINSLSGQHNILAENDDAISFDRFTTNSARGLSDINEVLDFVFDSVSQVSTIVGFNAAVLLPDGEVWRRASGKASDLPTTNDLTTDHLMGMGSITKTFVSATIMSLVEEGLLTLEDSIGHFMPDYPNITESVTVRQILNHTTGFNDFVNENLEAIQAWENDPNHIWTLDSLLTNYIGEPNFDPGEDWSYSNTNYLLAGKVIESVSGRPWHEEVRDRIIDPLGLDNTYGFPWEGLDGKPFASPYVDLDENGIMDDLRLALPDLSGYFSLAHSAGSLVSNPEDLALFMKGIFAGDLLSPSSVEEMTTTYNDPTSQFKYGLGCMSFDLPIFNWGHNGAIVFNSIAFYFGELDIAIAVQQNDIRLGDDFADLNVMISELLNAYIDAQMTSSTLEVSESDFMVYPNPASDRIEVKVDTEDFGNPITIRDSQGRVLVDQVLRTQHNTFYTDDFNSGLYIISVNGKTSKLIIQN